MQVFSFVHPFIMLSQLPLNSLNIFHSLVLQRHHLLPEEKTQWIKAHFFQTGTAMRVKWQ